MEEIAIPTDPPVPDRPSLASWDCLACRRRGCRRGGSGLAGGRVFDAGELRLLIIGLLGEHPRHGYEIIKALAERVGGGYQPSPGVVYPTLALLEESGLADSSPRADGRRLFALTATGRQTLAAERQALAAIEARLQGGATARSGPPPAVLEAMADLAFAVAERLRASPANPAEVAAIAAALKAAAMAVRRG
jgi:DNA-binding PadR family transcriptional regulator